MVVQKVFYLSFSCWSYVGFLGRNSQQISLASDCLKIGTVMHEIIHALGFHHEQSRSDRDQHVEIFWENIQAGREAPLYFIIREAFSF